MNRLSQILILVLGYCAATPLRAEVFPFDIGALGYPSGTMDIARDEGFQDKLVSIALGGKREYLINFPESALYFVRVRRQQTVVWQEAVVVLLEQPHTSPRLSWSIVPGAVRTRLWLSRGTLRTRWLETKEQSAQLHKIGTPWLVRLRGITAKGESLPVTRLTLQWDTPASKPEPPIAATAPDIHLDPNATDDDQVVYEPEDKDLLSGADESPMNAFVSRSTPIDLPPIQRKHEVYVWLRYLREQFSIDKKDRFEAEPSIGLGTGAGGQYFLAPNAVLSGAIDTHATQTDYEEAGTQTPSTVQKRIRLHVALGLDLLNTHTRTTDWSLNLGPVVGLVQMPLQQDDQKFTDYGISLGGHHYPTRSALTVLFLKSGSREIHARWIMPWTVWSMSPFLGTYLYNTRQSAGAVTGRFHESGLRFGLERDF
ncbi:MAG TPA: hypothetical protein VE954_22385 [Oligoflexus sp.]|uniref:hypothetical protein n=1 Tax=Oligoflexus sp. TaxID=1971216 RepID=UPI002D50D5B8|nr:hypothetical protein [Oligoflexus sp.]HYX35857.1 hypothetical protein [Oligoflexus sp.]